MKLILRKNDSATSNLLFIYNNYSALKNKDTLKLTSLVEIMKAFGKTETAVRMSISRATKAKIFKSVREGNEVSYTLTNLGRDAIQIWNEGADNFWERYQRRKNDWDGKWYVLNIDFKDDTKELKPKVSEQLQQLGFAPINTNTWISAYYQAKTITQMIKEYALENIIVEFYGELQIHKDMDIFLNEIFYIEKLKNAYTDFINKYKDKLTEFRTDSKSKTLSKPELVLPLLHGLGWSFYKIASVDPALPCNLLSSWEGDEATIIMRDLREILVKSTFQYLQKFD